MENGKDNLRERKVLTMKKPCFAGEVMDISEISASNRSVTVHGVVLVYDLCFFNLVAVDSPVSHPPFSATHFFLLKHSRFYSAVSLKFLACVHLL